VSIPGSSPTPATDIKSPCGLKRLAHLDEKSAFRPCGRDLAKCFQEHGMGVIRADERKAFVNTGRLVRSNPPQAGCVQFCVGVELLTGA